VVHLGGDRGEALDGVLDPTGRSANMAEPYWPGCVADGSTACIPVRTETGTSVRTERSTDSPRLSSRSRRPGDAARTTSLNEPPRRGGWFGPPPPSSSPRRNGGVGPIGPLRLETGWGRNVPARVKKPLVRSAAWERAWRENRNDAAGHELLIGTADRVGHPVVAQRHRRGLCGGRHGCTGRGSASRSGVEDHRESSVPETPSTMACGSSRRAPSDRPQRPSTNQILQSGLVGRVAGT